jgi:membrane-bound metal-dependent hydrolase YbcI (DUF457 family)
MDNITHTLFAVTLARAGLGRAGRGATAALIVASNAPDIDIVATIGGAQAYLQWHRGPTHGPPGVIGLGVAIAALIFLARKVADRRPAPAHSSRPEHQEGLDSPRGELPTEARPPARGDNASFRALTTVSILGVLLHVLMDLPTSYGTRLLSPFDWHWHGFDWMPIIDVYLWLALAAGLVLGRPGRARVPSAAIALLLMAGDYGLRAAAHGRAVDVAPRVFGPILPEPCQGAPPRPWIDRWPRPGPVAAGRCLVEIAATPGFRSPFEWRLIAQLSNGYLVQTVNLLRLPTGDSALRHQDLVPNVWTPAVARAAETPPAQVFLGFSRFPAVRVSVDREGVATVRWTDIRFSGGPDPPRPQNDGRGDLFGATVRVAPDGRILHARLGGR